MNRVLEAARKYVQAGLHVIPIKGDGTKRPDLPTWQEHQERQPREDELVAWFTGRPDRGVGIIGTGGLEFLDFDEPGLFDQFKAIVDKQAPGLLDRLPQVETPNGYHVYLRSDVSEPSQKLARTEQGKTRIETRGRGGYVVAPPSPGRCHPSGQPYVHVAGPEIHETPQITIEEREILLSVARTFDRRPQKMGVPTSSRSSSASPQYEEAREWVEHAPLARSGHGGHDMTFMVARMLVNDFALDRDAARELLHVYNERLADAGEETWTKEQLDHKLDSAVHNGGRDDHPYGCGRTAGEPGNDPHRLAGTFVQQHKWVYWHGRHFRYDGTKFGDVPDYEVAPMLSRHIKQSLDAANRKREEGSRRLAFSKTLVSNTLEALKGETLVSSCVPLPSLLPDGKKANLLGLVNGLLDFDQGQLRPHTPEWFSLVCLPYKYDPAATCPTWMKVLSQNLEGDAERIALIQQFAGYILMNSTDAQKFLFLVGEGANGKSVVLAGLHAMLGEENVSTVPLENFGDKFAMAQTLGKLANLSPEVGELDRTAEGTLKAFVGGDRMTFERKGKDPFTARPTARLVLSTNNVPRFADKTDGVWRRLLLVPFNRQVPFGERVAGMDKAEYWLNLGEVPGILNWALEGMRQLKNSGMRFVEPAICRVALDEHRRDSDPARTFLEERYAADPNAAAPLRTADLYQEYKNWCEENGYRTVSSNNFGRQVRRVFGVERSRSHRFDLGVSKAWFGIAARKLAA